MAVDRRVQLSARLAALHSEERAERGWPPAAPRNCHLIGARTVAQLDDSLDALKQLEFGPDELSEIDQFAKDGGIDLWREISLL
jgi:aryl-alcohol dehydrogenase-like predicted oxidoreductase